MPRGLVDVRPALRAADRAVAAACPASTRPARRRSCARLQASAARWSPPCRQPPGSSPRTTIPAVRMLAWQFRAARGSARVGAVDRQRGSRPPRRHQPDRRRGSNRASLRAWRCSRWSRRGGYREWRRLSCGASVPVWCGRFARKLAPTRRGGDPPSHSASWVFASSSSPYSVSKACASSPRISRR